VRELDVEADREPTALFGTAVRGLHHSRPTARDDREAGLGETPTDVSGLFVGRMPFPDASGAEERDCGSVDPLDGLEALQELVADPRRVREEVVAAAAL
jgi:hypothetical protein